jgi:hypothetical protein
VFSFAAATMINVDDKALTALKDVTLIVVGFYFDAAKAAGEEKEKDKKTDKTRGNAHPKADKASGGSVTPNPPDAGQPK